MTDAITFTVPGEPASKGRPRFSRASGRAYTPHKTLVAENWIRHHAIEAMDGRAPLDGPLSLQIRAFFSVPKSTTKAKRAEIEAGTVRPTKKPDADNIAKLADALNGIVFVDDSQVVTLHVFKLYAADPRMEISIFKI